MNNLLQRLHKALGPILGGIILDVVDLATFGPIGLIIGPFLGAAIGFWIASIYDLSKTGKVITTLLSAIYCTIPFSEVLPLATLFTACVRFMKDEKER